MEFSEANSIALSSIDSCFMNNIEGVYNNKPNTYISREEILNLRDVMYNIMPSCGNKATIANDSDMREYLQKGN